jgi:hypothetical protein
MKSPVSLRFLRLPAVVFLAVLGAVLALADIPAGQAQRADSSEAPAPPDAGWTERDYLLHYATVVCVRGAYGTLDPQSAPVLDALDAEAWAMIEFTRQEPAIYEAIHRLATARGEAEAPARALAACATWVKAGVGKILEGADIAD